VASTTKGSGCQLEKQGRGNQDWVLSFFAWRRCDTSGENVPYGWRKGVLKGEGWEEVSDELSFEPHLGGPNALFTLMPNEAIRPALGNKRNLFLLLMAAGLDCIPYTTSDCIPYTTWGRYEAHATNEGIYIRKKTHATR
jgi:hypothetical protein